MGDSESVPNPESPVIRFGPFALDRRARTLSRGRDPINLPSKAFDALEILVRNHGRVVEKEDMIQALWPGTVVEEGNLHHYVSSIRKALGEKAGEHRFIVTVPGRGYTFVAPLTSDEQTAAATTPTVSQAPHRSPRPGWFRRAAVIGVTAILLLGAAAWRMAPRGSATPNAVKAEHLLTTMPGWETGPTFSPDGASVAFSWRRAESDESRIYVKPIDSESLLQVTSGPGEELSPSWSPDGRLLAYYHTAGGAAGFYVVPPMGGAPRKIADTPPNDEAFRLRLIDWSRDSRELIVAEMPDPMRLSALSVETGRRRTLTSPPPTSTGDVGPAVSPDGNLIAFSHGVQFGVRELRLMKMAGGPSWTLPNAKTAMSGLAWSPDSKWIVSEAGNQIGLVEVRSGLGMRVLTSGGNTFPAVSSRGDLAYSQKSQQGEVRRYAVDGPRLLDAPAALPDLNSSTRATGLDVSSRYLALLAASLGGRGGREIWRSDLDGSNRLKLTQGYQPLDISWSPDGKLLAFCSRGAGEVRGNSDIYVVGADGGEPRRLTLEPSAEEHPSWSSDGRFVYFSSDRGGTWRSWKVPVEGGPATLVLTQGRRPKESPDGQYLYHCCGQDSSALCRVPVPTGAPELILEAEDLAASVWWAPSRNGLYYIDRGYALRFYDTIRHARSDKLAQFQKWQLSGGPLDDSILTLSRDGGTLLLSVFSRRESDLMMVAHFFDVRPQKTSWLP